MEEGWIFLSSDAICNLFLRIGGELNPEGNGYKIRTQEFIIIAILKIQRRESEWQTSAKDCGVCHSH